MSSTASNKSAAAAAAATIAARILKKPVYDFCYTCDYRFRSDNRIEIFEHMFHTFCSEKCYNSYMKTICPTCEEQLCSCSDYGPEVESTESVATKQAKCRLIYTYYAVEGIDGDDVSDSEYN